MVKNGQSDKIKVTLAKYSISKKEFIENYLFKREYLEVMDGYIDVKKVEAELEYKIDNMSKRKKSNLFDKDIGESDESDEEKKSKKKKKKKKKD